MRMRHPGNPEQTEEDKRNRRSASAQRAPNLRNPPFLGNSAEIEQPNGTVPPFVTIYDLREFLVELHYFKMVKPQLSFASRYTSLRFSSLTL